MAAAGPTIPGLHQVGQMAELASFADRKPAVRAGHRTPNRRAPRLPTISGPLLRWFTWYSRRYLRRHFHSLRISASTRSPASTLPLVLYSNQASWWDPLVCLVLIAELFPARRAFAPIDADALDRYRLFRQLGFFGVQRDSTVGARQFLRTTTAVLKEPAHLLALTPQGKFADPRDRPLRFQPGLGHLAAQVRNVAFVPMAIEYVFWEERLPEILVRFGQKVELHQTGDSTFRARDWTALFEQKLTATQDALTVQSRLRDPADCVTILHGGTGQGGLYAWWRACKARFRGKPFNPEHGQK